MYMHIDYVILIVTRINCCAVYHYANQFARTLIRKTKLKELNHFPKTISINLENPEMFNNILKKNKIVLTN